MKRLFVLLGLLAALLVAQTAQAAPFYFGGNATAGMTFDDKTDVEANLGYLARLDGSASFAPASAAFLDLSARWRFTGIGFSQYAVNKGLSAGVGGQGESGSAADGMRFQDEYLAGRISLGWFDDAEHQEIVMTLEDLITACVSAVYVLQSDLVFQLDNDPEPFSFAAGTIFFGIALPGSGNAVDLIMAAGPLAPPTVPAPAAVWLTGTGLAGIVALRRKIRPANATR